MPPTPAKPTNAPATSSSGVVPKGTPAKEPVRTNAKAEAAPATATNPVANSKGLSGKEASRAATVAVKAAMTGDPSERPNGFPPQPQRPKTWEEIKVGSLVIAHESMVDGWWEAIVLEVNGDKLTVRWRDYPRQPSVIRGKAEIAFLAKAA